jgi:bacillithiol biosynthesis deacetylase BshB1
MNLHLLAFGPHPDDVELSCGGWLAKAAKAGRSVGVVDLSAGEAATNGSPETRLAESRLAASILGLGHRETLGLPDAGLRAEDDEQCRAVVEVLRRLRPSLALAPWLEARHPDHAQAGRLLQRATFLAGLAKYHPELGKAHRPTRLIFYPQRHQVRPDFVVDVSEVYAVKHQAIAAHASQFSRDAAEGGDTLINSSVGLAAFEARDRFWGATIGVHHGEPYVLQGPVPISDPIDHFGEHPQSPALVPPS